MTSFFARHNVFLIPKSYCSRYQPAFPVSLASPMLVNPIYYCMWWESWTVRLQNSSKEETFCGYPRCPPHNQHTLLIRKERRESWNKGILEDAPTIFVNYHTIRKTSLRANITRVLEILKINGPVGLLFPNKQLGPLLSKPKAPVTVS